MTVKEGWDMIRADELQAPFYERCVCDVKLQIDAKEDTKN
jgi:hypothetical protein